MSAPSSEPRLARDISTSVVHGDLLPERYASEIPAADELILRFLLAFLREEGLGSVPVFINGGYVRDLLLGKRPDDLDLSFCLRDCPQSVTVFNLLEKMQAFADSKPELGIVKVKSATILSDETKNKLLDTAKAYFIDTQEHKTEVDIMPTIGEEVYDEGSRIPVRDQRGTPEQDALRRDLTIGAMLLRVELDEEGVEKLRYHLFDFYGGAADLRNGVLRGPYPKGRVMAELLGEVLRTAEERELAAGLRLQELPEDEAVQVIWWAKILIEDPVRICRALRFAVKLKGFELHKSFWQSVPFALPALQSKVAGSRKNTEFVKIGGYGFEACLSFIQMAFSHTFRGSTTEDLRLASFLFGGVDSKGNAHVLPPIRAFAGAPGGAFEEVAQALSPRSDRGELDAAELLGGLLASAIHASEFEGGEGPEQEFAVAIRGLCASNAVRDAGACPLAAAARLAEGTAQLQTANGLDHAFAAACGAMGVEELLFYEHCYDAFKLADGPGSKFPAGVQNVHRLRLAMAVLRHKDPQVAARAEVCLQVLQRPRPVIKGGVFSLKGLVEVPNQLRGHVMKLMDISLRLLEYDGPLEDEAQMRQLLEAHPKLQEALSGSVWFKEGPGGRTLRDEFAPPPRKERKTDAQGKGKAKS